MPMLWVFRPPWATRSARPGQATVVALPVIDTLDTVLGLYEKA